jgi:HSP20 family protein
MMANYGDPFEALFALQRALDARLDSDWMGESTAGMGSYPPINVFQKGDDFVAVVELPGVSKDDLQIEAKENTVRISGNKTTTYEKDASVHRRERLSGVSRYQSKSILTAYVRSTVTAFLRSSSRVPRAKSRELSKSNE